MCDRTERDPARHRARSAFAEAVGHQHGVAALFERRRHIAAAQARGQRLLMAPHPHHQEVIFIAVGTPQGEDGSSDLRYLLEAVATIKQSAQNGTVIVLKSTVPVGTSDKVRMALQGAKAKIEIVSNPEFLKEGTAVNDFLKPERVVVGTQSEMAREVMKELYAPYIRSGNPILFMSNRSAELSKYAANSFLAMKISFINDLALLSERVEAEITDVRRAIITDSRIGSQFLYPGCGYGGSCFPKDVLALVQVGKEFGLKLDLFSAVHEINERQKHLLFQKIHKCFKGNIQGKTLAIWGLAFKPMTDDMREAPSVTLIRDLLKAGAKVQAYDPVAKNEARHLFENKVQLFDDAYEAVRNADGLVPPSSSVWSVRADAVASPVEGSIVSPIDHTRPCT